MGKTSGHWIYPRSSRRTSPNAPADGEKSRSLVPAKDRLLGHLAAALIVDQSPDGGLPCSEPRPIFVCLSPLPFLPEALTPFLKKLDGDNEFFSMVIILMVIGPILMIS
jgi:hypothetical protein